MIYLVIGIKTVMAFLGVNKLLRVAVKRCGPSEICAEELMIKSVFYSYLYYFKIFYCSFK